MIGPLTRSQIRALRLERRRRERAASAGPQTFDPAKHCFPEQLGALQDPTRHRAFLLGRGGGKTTLAQYALFHAATTMPGVAVVYISTTINRARKTVWDDLRAMNRDMRLGGQPRELQSPEIYFPANGSRLYVSGGETRKHVDRWRGVKRIALVWVDEGQDWDDDLLTYAINSVFLPRLNDRRNGVSINGRLAVSGTGRSPTGYYHRIMTDASLGFGIHRWNADANPGVEPMAVQIAEACRVRGVGPDDPYIRREYYAEFTRDGVLQVFPVPQTFGPEALLAAKLFYVIGADVGSVDRTACAVWAWTPYADRLFLVEADEARTPASSDQVAFIRSYIERYERRGLMGTAVDPGGGGKGVIEDLRKIRNLWEVTEAMKSTKVSACRNLAGDLRTGRAMVASGATRLMEALPGPEWDPAVPGEKLKGHMPDIVDATLYGYRLAAQLWHAETQPREMSPVERELARLYEEQQREEDTLRDAFG